jgi:outer membrane protein
MVLLLSFLTGGIMFSQSGGNELRLSLKEAQEYALQNNKNIKSAKLTVESSKSDVWSTVAAGLPQVSVNGTLTDNLKLGVFVMTMNDPATGASQTMVITMGMKYSVPITLEASMPLFSAPYYVGIESVKLAQKLSESSLLSTEIDTRQSVASSYYLILVSEESLRILNNNITNLKEISKSTRAMYNAGLAEATDIDQMESNVTMAENSYSSLQSTVEMNYNLLRFQLGLKSDSKIILTETLDDLTKEINVNTVLAQELNLSNNIQYDLIDKQEKLSVLNVKAQKARVLPSLAGFYSTSTSGMGMKISDFDWYRSANVGLQLSVPIFASGQRYSQIRKAQIDLDKSRNNKDMVVEQLDLQERQLKFNLDNANKQYLSQKGNVEVSKRVYSSTENKYKQGMASSLDLTQANQLYLQAENNYISSVLNLLQTKLSLDKLLNNLQ